MASEDSSSVSALYTPFVEPWEPWEAEISKPTISGVTITFFGDDSADPGGESSELLALRTFWKRNALNELILQHLVKVESRSQPFERQLTCKLTKTDSLAVWPQPRKIQLVRQVKTWNCRSKNDRKQLKAEATFSSSVDLPCWPKVYHWWVWSELAILT